MNAMTDNPVREFANAASQEASAVALSVLIPFYRDDPADLLRALAEQIGNARDIEIVLHDDGEPDPELNAGLARILAAMSQPARLLTSTRNRGRSAGRNLLAAQARGEWLLYLDADMAPASPAFLPAYRQVMASREADAAFGGYETAWPAQADYRLHAALARNSDQHDALARTRIGATAYCSSNLLVRAEVMRQIPYDTGFAGWGWEDVDWAVRAAERFNLVHIDNPALHGGLQRVEVLLEKFRIGATNYRRLLDRHPGLARLPGARIARMLGRLPFQAGLRGLWAALSRSAAVPMKLRVAALKLWRASWTAEAIR
jgi:glycosyltransferase involved in cell wall biosynthesis